MTARERRAVVWGAAAIAATLLGARVAQAAAGQYRALRVRAEERVETLARASEAVAERRTMQDSLSRLGARVLGLAPALVAVGSAAHAAAELSGVVASLAGRHDLRVVEIQPLSDSERDRLGQAVVRARVEGDVAGLTGFVSQLETDDRVLSLSSWAMYAPEGATAAGGPERLRAEVEITGWYVRRERP